MITIELTQGGHKWRKKNLMTIFKGRKHFDILRCEVCGIEGKTNSIATISIKETYNRNKVYNCTGKHEIAKKIKIIKCTAYGETFANLIPNSTHDVIEAPNGYSNDTMGVWVQGVGEPVKVLSYEYEEIN